MYTLKQIDNELSKLTKDREYVLNGIQTAKEKTYTLDAISKKIQQLTTKRESLVPSMEKVADIKFTGTVVQPNGSEAVFKAAPH